MAILGGDPLFLDREPGLRGVLAIGESAVLDGADEERCPRLTD